MKILAIDPGPEQSGFVLYHPAEQVILKKGIVSNRLILRALRAYPSPMFDTTYCVIEMITSYGMAVGESVFRTCIWIGRFIQQWREFIDRPVYLVPRLEVRLSLCKNTKAKDENVRRALIDLFGGDNAIGKKKTPGPLYGVHDHEWAALGLAVAFTREYTDGIGLMLRQPEYQEE